jgi:hypothetical protein
MARDSETTLCNSDEGKAARTRLWVGMTRLPEERLSASDSSRRLLSIIRFDISIAIPPLICRIAESQERLRIERAKEGYYSVTIPHAGSLQNLSA